MGNTPVFACFEKENNGLIKIMKNTNLPPMGTELSQLLHPSSGTIYQQILELKEP